MSGARALGLQPGRSPFRAAPFDAGPVVEGATLAGVAFVQQLARHGSWPVEQFVARAQVTAAEADWRAFGRGQDGGAGAVPHGRSPGWTFCPLDALPDRLERGALALVHTQEGPRLHVMAAMRRRWARSPVPLTAVTHGLAGQGRMVRSLFALLLAASLPCDAIVCISRAAQSALDRLLEGFADRLEPALGRRPCFPGQMPLIPWGVDTERFRPADRAQARVRLGLPPDGLIALAMGRLSPATKMDLAPLLLALARLRGSVAPPVSLLIAGADWQGYGARTAARAAAMDLGRRVTVVTDVAPAAVPDLYAAADLFVSASDTVCESLGLSVQEAMAAGLPCVVSDWDGYRDLVRDGENGFLVPTRWAACDAVLAATAPVDRLDGLCAQAQSVAVDVPALAEGMRRLAGSEALRRQMGAAGRRIAEQEYAWPRIIAAYESLWAKLCERAASIEWPPADAPIGTPDLFDTFRGWPSHVVDDVDCVRLTARGAAWAGGEDAPPMLRRLAVGLSWDGLRALALELASRDVARWVEVDAWCGDRLTMDREAAASHLLWLVKYGFAAVHGAGGG